VDRLPAAEPEATSAENSGRRAERGRRWFRRLRGEPSVPGI